MERKKFFEKILAKLEPEVFEEKIEEIEIYKVKLKFHKTFTIATGSMDFSENLIIILKSGNEYGIGEGYYIEEDVKNDLKLLKELKDKKFIDALEYVLKRRYTHSVRLPLSMALLDNLSRLKNIRYGDIFSENYKNNIDTDVTIGIKSIKETLEEFNQFTKMGFKSIKIKVGESLDKDLKKLKQIEEFAPSEIKIRIDANQGWTPEEAREAIKKLNKMNLNLELIEQPVPKDQYEKVGELRKLTDIPIILDESVHTADDVLKVAKYTDGVNMKPTKAGDILEISYGYHMASDLDLRKMIGCSTESNIGITSSTYIAATLGVEFVDLDSDILQEDTLKSKVTRIEDGCRILPTEKGLGVRLDFIEFKKFEKIL